MMTQILYCMGSTQILIATVAMLANVTRVYRQSAAAVICLMMCMLVVSEAVVRIVIVKASGRVLSLITMTALIFRLKASIGRCNAVPVIPVKFSPGGWSKVRFDHDTETEFPLRGGHVEAGCVSCHRGDAYSDDLAVDCYSCHVADDVHQGQEGRQCESCHAEEGWDKSVRFNHDMASFPLIGLHAVVPCEECHLSATFREVGKECGSCHQADDIHKQQLGAECENCHNPNAWALWEFDHNKQSGFHLDGAHEGLDCLACHTRPVRKNISLSTSCGGCHRNDDVHDGRFGSACERCHDTESFDAVELR